MSVTGVSARREDRVDLLVRANLFAANGGGIVRLCNISPIGALIEANDLPAIGNIVELRRGALSVPGEIVWRSKTQAGVSFAERTDVIEWFPDAAPQASVDKAFQRIMEEFHQRRERAAGQSVAPNHQSLITVDDMERVAAALDDLADTIAEDHKIVAHFAEKLQTLDVAAQVLRKLADQIEEQER